jgi:hypothetical protein
MVYRVGYSEGGVAYLVHVRRGEVLLEQVRREQRHCSFRINNSSDSGLASLACFLLRFIRFRSSKRQCIFSYYESSDFGSASVGACAKQTASPQCSVAGRPYSCTAAPQRRSRLAPGVPTWPRKWSAARNGRCVPRGGTGFVQAVVCLFLCQLRRLLA